MSSRVLLAAVLALPLCAACGGSRPLEPPRDDAAHWHAVVSDRSPRFAWDLPLDCRIELQPPEADHAQGDHESPIPRLTVNVFSSGNVIFKGKEWRWATGSEGERRDARTVVRNELQRLCADPALRDAEGFNLVPVMIHADRRAPWRTVRDVVPILREPEIRVRHLLWAVHEPRRDFAARRVDFRVGAVMTPIAEAEEETTPLVVRIGTSLARGGTRVEVAGRSWSFGEVGEGFTDSGFLARANAIWDEVEAWLPEAAQGSSSARVEIVDEEDDLCWAYVVTTLDLLLGAGMRDVSLPDAGVRLRLDEPDVPDATVLQVYADDPVLTPGTVVACLLAVLLAFAATFLPLRRRP